MDKLSKNRLEGKMCVNKIEELRDKLNDLIFKNEYYSEILKVSQELDVEIIKYYLSKFEEKWKKINEIILTFIEGMWKYI